MGKNVRLVLVILLIMITFAAIMPISVYADAPYRSFVPTWLTLEAPAPDAYLPERQIYGTDVGTTMLNDPQDIFVTEESEIYILDSGNGRIIILDKDFKLKKEITEKDITASLASIKGAKGIFVKSDGTIYISDTVNKRVLVMDQQGVVKMQISKPDDSDDIQIFQPEKVVVDSAGMIYVICKGVYNGALLYDKDGNFVTFYGSPKVQVTAEILLDRFWRLFMTNEQRSKMSNYVPMEFKSFDIDKSNFVYTCSEVTENQKEQIRKLNPMGLNIYPFKDDFGETQNVYHKRVGYITKFVDIAVEGDFFWAVDSTRGRIYQYDQEGVQLITFGTLGSQKGAFVQPVAIDTIGENVLVLDAAKRCITVFKPTEYGESIMQGIKLFNDGLYEESLDFWNKVLKMNGNYELAYVGKGQAMVKLRRYEEAVELFRLGNDRYYESKAFKLYRSEYMREHFTIIMIVILTVFIALIAVTSKQKGFVKKIYTRLKLKEGR